MRRSSWHRALSALLAVWFGVFVAEPAWLHACPVHSPAGAGGHAAHAPTGHHPPAHHHARAGHHVPASGGEGAPHQCTCPGACCAVSPQALPAVALHAALAVTVAAADRGRPEHEYVAAWVDFVLPFAHAPPHPAALA